MILGVYSLSLIKRGVYMEFIPKYKSKYNDIKVKKDNYGFTPKYNVKPKVRSLTKSYQSRLIKEKSKKYN